jgi:hypothetical protein
MRIYFSNQRLTSGAVSAVSLFNNHTAYIQSNSLTFDLSEEEEEEEEEDLDDH